jgi:hypothetical protein
MPRALTIDKKEVHATFLATGSLTETARLHGLKDATIRQWAKRYNWETATQVQKLRQKADNIVELKREKGHSDVVEVSRSADALSNHLHSTGVTFKTNMATALSRSSQELAEMDGLTALEQSRRMVDLATAASKVFPNMEGEAKLNVNVLSMGLDAFVGSRGLIDTGS